MRKDLANFKPETSTETSKKTQVNSQEISEEIKQNFSGSSVQDVTSISAVDSKNSDTIKKPKSKAKKDSQKYVINKCPHVDKKFYAKGMCNHCYHHYGRPFTATKCIHKDRMSFAKGLCLQCY